MKLLEYQSYPSILCKSFIYSILGILLGYFLFRIETSLISVFLTTLSLLWTAGFLFERNTREIWEKITTPLQANKKLTISLVCIFIGVMFGYGVFVLFTNTSIIKELLSIQLGIYKEIKISIQDINFSSFNKIFFDNFAVLILVFFVALIYRIGGVVLVIVWNASVWGSVFAYIIKSASGTAQINPVYYFFATILCISPHLSVEALGYILCSMSGFFISKGITKYDLGSFEFKRALKASSVILLISIMLILLSAFLESVLTSKLISIFFKN
jgi:hypothetical protein